MKIENTIRASHKSNDKKASVNLMSENYGNSILMEVEGLLIEMNADDLLRFIEALKAIRYHG